MKCNGYSQNMQFDNILSQLNKVSQIPPPPPAIQRSPKWSPKAKFCVCSLFPLQAVSPESPVLSVCATVIILKE